MSDCQSCKTDCLFAGETDLHPECRWYTSNTNQSLREVIQSRERRADSLRQGICNQWWDGYYCGQLDAYKDLVEILEQYAPDLLEERL